ncbi:unnamed protein product [Orchesella dallaii]|uniref:Negative elongation factor E n=1 Tax=Orchesella dallaii TaxID=48710 RepID=A0ABP1RSH4_9HEXA
MSYNLRVPNSLNDEESDSDDNGMLRRQTEDDALDQAEAALERAEKPEKLLKRAILSPSKGPSLKPFQRALRSLKQINSPVKRSTPNPVNRATTNPSSVHPLKRPTNEDAKEHAKKLLLAGKIVIPSSTSASHEKISFKRPTLEKKIATASVTTDFSRTSATPTSSFRNCTPPKHPVEFGGSSHPEVTVSAEATMARPIPIMRGEIEVPKTRPFIIPRLDTSSIGSISAPKRGPAIYVCLKDQAVRRDVLRTTFERFGRIFGIRIGRTIGTAFVTFTTIESAERAINEVCSIYFRN